MLVGGFQHTHGPAGGVPAWVLVTWCDDSASLSLRFASRLSQRRVSVLIPAVASPGCLTDGGRSYPGCQMLVSGADYVDFMLAGLPACEGWGYIHMFVPAGLLACGVRQVETSV